MPSVDANAAAFVLSTNWMLLYVPRSKLRPPAATALASIRAKIAPKSAIAGSSQRSSSLRIRWVLHARERQPERARPSVDSKDSRPHGQFQLRAVSTLRHREALHNVVMTRSCVTTRNDINVVAKPVAKPATDPAP